MSGTNQCYTCEYQCDAEERYYPSDELCTTNNKGRTCSLDGLSQCYTPTGCDEKQGYYEDLPLCMQTIPVTPANPKTAVTSKTSRWSAPK